MGETGELFGELPEQVGPQRAPSGGAPRLRQAERCQTAWRMTSLEDLVGSDHRVRQVWAFAQGLDLAPQLARIGSVEGRAGHPAADPRLLLALWLLTTIERVGSARALARLCVEHHAYRWLSLVGRGDPTAPLGGEVSMNHKSLADFRVAHGELLKRLLVDGFAALLRAGIASLERVAQDGMRVRASAGAGSFRRRSTLERCREVAAARVVALRAELEADPGASTRRQQAAQQRAARERQERVDRALAAAAALAEARGTAPPADPATDTGPDNDGPSSGAAPRSEPRASTTDAEARVMKMADGGFRPAFDVQLVSDTGTGMILDVEVDNQGTDMGKLAPTNDRLTALYGRRPGQQLVDGGYTRLACIERLEQQGCQVFAPVPRPRDPQRDRHAPRPGDPPGVAAWRWRMGTDAASAIYKQRASTAECANAQARNRGLRQFPVRGTVKAKAVALWLALAHNMTRIWALQPG